MSEPAFIYNKLIVLTPGQRNRLRRRTKNNYDRTRRLVDLYKQLHFPIYVLPGDCLITKTYTHLCQKLQSITKDLVLIDEYIHELKSNNTNSIRYINGSVVTTNSIDYLILNNRTSNILT